MQKSGCKTRELARKPGRRRGIVTLARASDRVPTVLFSLWEFLSNSRIFISSFTMWSGLFLRNLLCFHRNIFVIVFFLCHLECFRMHAGGGASSHSIHTDTGYGQSPNQQIGYQYGSQTYNPPFGFQVPPSTYQPTHNGYYAPPPGYQPVEFCQPAYSQNTSTQVCR